MEYVIKCGKGIDDVLFGMSPNEVQECLGKAQQRKFETESKDMIVSSEVRDGITFTYEKNMLVCMSSALMPPRFILDGKQVPHGIIQVNSFFKKNSPNAILFPDLMSSIFPNLGIVLYPYEIHDMDAGKKQISTSVRLAICNFTILRRFHDLFLEDTKIIKGKITTWHNGQKDTFLSHHLYRQLGQMLFEEIQNNDD